MQPQQPTPRPHVWRTGFLIGIILAVISGISVYAWQQIMLNESQAETQKAQNMIADLESDKAELEADLVRTKHEKEEFQQIAQAKQSFTYKNLVYGFELTMPAEFDGYWTNQEAGDSTRGEKMIRFYVDATGYSWPNEAFDPLVVRIYPKGWWAKNAEINEFNDAYVKGVDQTMTTHLGTFLGANEQYVITASAGVHDCPGKQKSDGTYAPADALCSLPKVATDKVFSTFKEIDIF